MAKAKSNGLTFGAVATAAGILTGIAIVTTGPRPAIANPNIAKATGEPCAKCHTAPPALTSYGKKYKDSQKK